MVNPPPVQTPVDEGAKVSKSWMMWFNQLFSYLRGIVDYANSSIQTPVAGFNITITDNVQVTTLTPAGVLATGTIKMPQNPYNGQTIQVSSSQTVTALTVSPNTGQTLLNAPTTLLAGVGFSYYYNTANAVWYRLS